jgi:hypothetical protein
VSMVRSLRCLSGVSGRRETGGSFDIAPGLELEPDAPRIGLSGVGAWGSTLVESARDTRSMSVVRFAAVQYRERADSWWY